MALGSSAPEIILALYETLMNIDGCPGELGASTIVGSAAFNLLVISGLSIYAVDEECDKNPERDPKTPLGVKKIYDMGVYAITATSSVLAYVWMFYVLMDQNVSVVEAWLTFFFFFVLIVMAYAADKYKGSS
jgi:solute carrier family 8 (sodium/calcium exchanger)